MRATLVVVLFALALAASASTPQENKQAAVQAYRSLMAIKGVTAEQAVKMVTAASNMTAAEFHPLAPCLYCNLVGCGANCVQCACESSDCQCLCYPQYASCTWP